MRSLSVILLAEADTQDGQEALDENFARHLGLADATVHKDDRNFDDFEAVL